jgi:adenylosuccinate synthase
MMMKGDVLSGLDTIKVCNQYKTEEGLIDHFPFDINPESVSPEYIEVAGWEADLTQINSVDKLPKNFIDYIHFLERELKTPIKIVSVGPDRKQTIMR